MSSKTRPDLNGVSGIGNPLFTVCRQGAFLVAESSDSFLLVSFLFMAHIIYLK